MALRCWLFGHSYLHLDTHFIDGNRLASSHICDRCGEERTVVLEVADLTEPLDTTDSPEEVTTDAE